MRNNISVYITALLLNALYSCGNDHTKLNSINGENLVMNNEKFKDTFTLKYLSLKGSEKEDTVELSVCNDSSNNFIYVLNLITPAKGSLSNKNIIDSVQINDTIKRFYVSNQVFSYHTYVHNKLSLVYAIRVWDAYEEYELFYRTNENHEIIKNIVDFCKDNYKKWSDEKLAPIKK